MVDIHCHILPAVDDGARDWQTALAMCQIAAQDGIRHIVATPHANAEFIYNREAHAALLAELRSRCGDDLTFSLGCDFHFSFENFQDVLRSPERYCIEGTRYLLVEFSDFSIAPNTGDLLRQLLRAGITPILTHPERNQLLQREMTRVLEWADMGCVVQVTANTFTDRWGDRAKKAALSLLEHDAVHVLATDAHSTRSRPPVLSEARAYVGKHYSSELAEMLVEGNPAAIIAGQPLPYFPSPV
jgi:protein-tyrosine phosphatase